jgi:hypothetical protein
MTKFTQEIERLRQRMTEDARTGEVEMVRLAAEMESLQTGLLEQLRNTMQAFEQRREGLVAEMRKFSDSLGSPHAKQYASVVDERLFEPQWLQRQSH